MFSPRLAGFVLDAFRDPVAVASDEELDLLTAREKDVLRLIARGFPYKQVARNLDVSVKTVETHRERIKEKLNLASGSELIRYAMQYVMDEMRDKR